MFPDPCDKASRAKPRMAEYDIFFIGQKIIDTDMKTLEDWLACPPLPRFTCHVVEAKLTLRGPLSCAIGSFRLRAFKALHFPVTIREQSTH